MKAYRGSAGRIVRPFTLNRREFLAGALALPVTAWRLGAADILHSLKPNDFERLRLDFNSNRGKVRLLFVLSPT